MPPITYDTSVFKSYKPEAFPSGFLFSAVVMQELMASANDDSEMTCRPVEGKGTSFGFCPPITESGRITRRNSS